ncbi:hypothetical protein D9M72_583650 [compost metagenome]
MTPPGIGKRCRAGAEKSLQLVGAQRLERRDAGNQHGGNGDHAAAAGDRIDEAGEEGGNEQEGEQVEGEILHGRDSGRGRRMEVLPPCVRAGHDLQSLLLRRCWPPGRTTFESFTESKPCPESPCFWMEAPAIVG